MSLVVRKRFVYIFKVRDGLLGACLASRLTHEASMAFFFTYYIEHYLYYYANLEMLSDLNRYQTWGCDS